MKLMQHKQSVLCGGASLLSDKRSKHVLCVLTFILLAQNSFASGNFIKHRGML